MSHLALLILTPAAQNMICATIVNQFAMRLQLLTCKSVLVWYPEQLRIQHVDFGKVLGNAYGAPTYRTTELLVSLLEQHRIASHSVLVTFENAEIQTTRSRNTYLVYPSVSSGALPETILKNPKMGATDTMRSTCKLSRMF